MQASNCTHAAVLTGEVGPRAMAARLTRYYGAVVVKLGGASCVLAVPGEAPVPIAAHPVRATDTTGAGDAFCGAFAAELARGADPFTAARSGVVAGSLATTVPGAYPGLPRREAIERMLVRT